MTYQEESDFVNPEEKLYVENLRDFKEIFYKFGIQFWLDWGTLLGAVRDKKMITWDHDIDLGVFGDDYKKIVSTFHDFKKRGFTIDELPIPNTEFSSMKVYFGRFRYHIDIWPYYYLKNENNIGLFDADELSGNFIERKLTAYLWLLWRLLSSAQISMTAKRKKFKLIVRFTKYYLFLLPNRLKNHLNKKVKQILIKKNNGTYIKRIIVPKHYFETLESIEFYGITFNIPSNVKDYLKLKYGKNWKNPVKNWNWNNDGAVRFIRERSR